MYKCATCGEKASPRTPLNKIVVETRPATYPTRKDVHWVPKKGEKGAHWEDDPGGTGQEIVRELGVCSVCAAKASAA